MVLRCPGGGAAEGKILEELDSKRARDFVDHPSIHFNNRVGRHLRAKATPESRRAPQPLTKLRFISHEPHCNSRTS